ncbi:MAG: hypothetical protein AAGG48_10105 [Planctomycetota bacterium]
MNLNSQRQLMKLPWFIFALLLAMCGAVGGVLLTKEPSQGPINAGHGLPHPTIKSMQIGGDSAVRYAPIRISVWVFAVGMVFFFTALLRLASQKGETVNRLRWPLAIGCVAYLTTVIGMLISYEHYITDPDPRLRWGFPIPSAWMLFAVWPTPLLFVILYVATFSRWTFRPEDERAFERILAERASAVNETANQAEGAN